MEPSGVDQGFWIRTSMLEFSSSKSLASESKRFSLWVELVAPGLPSAGQENYSRKGYHLSREINTQEERHKGRWELALNTELFSLK
ncbi:hypothetical protein H5410_033861 [Solanum commersonii]|uniref:Uncharacterized protein n=1 Tax=Solanum commersonii TaxID=4109 RepID=A0A9J5YP13_SOLCO|nr:hypothetical protein H5410_033861 [Solanum commersonii]